MPNQKFDLLIVDDSVVLRMMLWEALASEGYSIDQAASGLQALEQIKLNSYRLILLDVKMPIMDGLETLQEIRQIDCQLPIVLMTACESQVFLESGDTWQKVSQINKPFDLDDLRNIVRNSLVD